MKFFILDFFSKCDQIRSKLRIWSHLLKKSLTENFNFRAVIFEGAVVSGRPIVLRLLQYSMIIFYNIFIIIKALIVCSRLHGTSL